MKHFVYLILKFYTFFSIKFYFNEVKVIGKEKLKGGGPFLFAANHQNAFMDGLIIVIVNPFPVHFLIRADIFKKKWAASLLRILKLMPVYRIRDGFSSLSKNQEQFDECIQLFKRKESVLIFPEGNHGETRMLRPLSKGFTRIAFEALKQYPDMNLMVVPTGINYSHYRAFNSRVSIYYGDPIPVKEYFKEPFTTQSNLFKERIDVEIKKLVTHIDDSARYEEILSKLNATNPDYFNPVDTNERIQKIMKGESIIRTERKVHWMYKIVHLLKPLGRLINFPVELGWRKFEKKIKDPVFTTSMKFGYGYTVVQIYYLLIMGVASIWLGWWALALYPLLLSSLKVQRLPV